MDGSYAMDDIGYGASVVARAQGPSVHNACRSQCAACTRARGATIQHTSAQSRTSHIYPLYILCHTLFPTS